MHPILRIGLLLRRVQGVNTRKKFQKLVHILQVMGAPFPESYDFHFYGPYSAELRRELDAFAGEGLIQEEAVRSNFPSFNLAPTPKLLSLLEEDPNLPNPGWLDWAEELNKQQPQTLEGISTLLYLHQRKWSRDTWKEKFHQLKPQLSARFAACEAEALRLLDLAGQKAA